MGSGHDTSMSQDRSDKTLDCCFRWSRFRGPALVAILAAASILISSDASGYTRYFDGVLTYREYSGFNNHTYNKAYNAEAGYGAGLKVYEWKSNLERIYEISGRGWVDITHPASYTQTVCESLEGYNFLVHCTKDP